MATVLQAPEHRSIVAPAGPIAGVLPARAVLRRGLVVVAVGLAAAALIVTIAVSARFGSEPANVIVTTGRIEGREVSLAPKAIQGRVTRLLADEGDQVNAGQLVAELDAAQIDAQYQAAAATLANLDAQVRQAAVDVGYTAKSSGAAIAAAEAGLATADAHAVRAEAIRGNAVTTYQRMVALFDGGAVSRQDVDQAQTALRTSEADVAAAAKEVLHARANLTLAQASVDTIALKRQQLRVLEESRRTAAAKLLEAEANRAERQIVSPLDATVVSRSVEVGDVVAPGSPLFRLVDMNRLYVKVYVPEPEVGKVRLGAAADVGVDAFPGRAFAAYVSKIYSQAEFTPKNVETRDERLKLVFGVELALDNADGLLKPGMPADCRIRWTDGSPEAGRGSR